MKNLLVLYCLFPVVAISQPGPELDRIIQQPQVEAHIRFLASDQMRGRANGSPELQIAAKYISESLRSYGALPANGDSYFQKFRLLKTNPPKSGIVNLQGTEFQLGAEMGLISGSDINWEKEGIFGGYGLENDLDKRNLQEKILITQAGSQGNSDVSNWLLISKQKVLRARELGAVGLIELYNHPTVSWPAIANFMTKSKYEIQLEGEAAEFPVLWINDVENVILNKLENSKKPKVELNLSENLKDYLEVTNVIGVIEGRDPKFQGQIEHYD